MPAVRLTRLILLAGLLLAPAGCGQPNPVVQGRSVSQWIERLGEKDPEESAAAIAALVGAGEDALPRVVAALDHADWELRCGAACVLLKSGPSWQEQVEELLAAGDAEHQLSLAQAVFRSGTESTAAVQIVLAHLKHDDPMIRHLATHVLGDLSPASRPAVPALVEALKSADAEIRFRAMFGLLRIGPAAADALPAVTTALNDPDQRVRLGAVQALGAMGKPARSAATAVTKLLEDPSDEVRYRAKELLDAWEEV